MKSFRRSLREKRHSSPNSTGKPPPTPSSPSISGFGAGASVAPGGRSGALHAHVLYDFVPEKPDELAVHPNENLIICAHHNFDWFIAKPIERLGGPGLVPVSYVKLTNLKTGQVLKNIEEAVKTFEIPTVEEWKSRNRKYQASSIALLPTSKTQSLQPKPKSKLYNTTTNIRGSYNSTSSLQTTSTASNSIFTTSTTNNRNSSNNNNNLTGITSPTSQARFLSLNDPIISASVPSYYCSNDTFWFLVLIQTSNGHFRKLCRLYQDFYDFQVKLLDTFPQEAGSPKGPPRILPFIPGPVAYINDSITISRMQDFNTYVSNIINLKVEKILKNRLVLNFFNCWDGDLEEIGKYPDRLPTRPGWEEIKLIDEEEEDFPINDEIEIDIQKTDDHNRYQYDGSDTDSGSGDDGINFNIGRLSNPNDKSQVDNTHTRTDTTNTFDTLNTSESDLISPINDSSETQTQIQLNSNAIANGNGEVNNIKIKFFYETDLFALIIPSNIQLSSLISKVSDKLSLDPNLVSLTYLPGSYKADKSFNSIDSSNSAKDEDEDDEDDEIVIIDDDDTLFQILKFKRKVVFYIRTKC